MKKIFLSLVSFVLCVSLSAFEIREHATIAYIAEQHLTPETRAVVSEILAGEHLCEVASYPDLFRKEPGWLKPNGKDYKHSYFVDENFRPTGKGVDGTLNETIEIIKDWKNLSQEDRFKYMSFIVHFVGDLHCPSHIHYADGRDTRANYVNYKFKDSTNRVWYHSFWDAFALSRRYLCGFMELAYIFDTWSEERIAEVQEGSINDWAYDNALVCKDIHDLEDEAEITRPYVVRKCDVIKEQVTKAGYRLAGLLNTLFG